MPDIREVLKALGPEDKTLWQQCRTSMRSVYLNAHNSTVGVAGWDKDDDAFLDLIDIRLALLFDRSGRLETTKEIVHKDDGKQTEKDLEVADDKMKAKQEINQSDATKLLAVVGQNEYEKQNAAADALTGWPKQ